MGKGTFAKLLVKDLNYNHISTGDEIRKILKGQVKIIKIKILSYFIHNYKGTSIIWQKSHRISKVGGEKWWIGGW